MTDAITWQPKTSLTVLRERARLLSTIREFMAARQILEVETPILNTTGVTEPNICNICTQPVDVPSGFPKLYLQSSPEYFMKRLLAAGSGPIFQITKAFRGEEVGVQHTYEFSLLEWYQVGYDYRQLMDEVNALLQSLGLVAGVWHGYQEVFLQATGIDPHIASINELQAIARQFGFFGVLHRSVLLDLIFSHKVTPKLGFCGPEFVYDYPTCQAALATIRDDTIPAVSERFEVFISGKEIANGFNELTDATEQRARFVQDNKLRALAGHPTVPLDEQFLSALSFGLPQCAGVAVGIDRLLMVLLDVENINQVINFTFNDDL